MRKVVFESAPELTILYQDEYLVAIDKPSGLLVHRSEIDKRETLFAMQLTRDLIGQHVYPVHRLDRPTSGVLLFALSSEVARKMSELFIAGLVSKTYLAVIRGTCPEQLHIDYALKEILDKKSDKKANKDKEPQSAQTSLRRLAQVELPFPSGRYAQTRYSLVELTPHTGRKHQLRRHMAHIRHPIIGDTNHGDGKQNKAAKEHLGLDRLALVAKNLSFPHPISNEIINISADIDPTLTHLFNLFSPDSALIY
ncbi:tRNA pseudouridine(65) synthase TruC [Psychrosphaera sp. F3M07]|uniref:tRNA pseudouridine(65) synthase TruC n=1 Tax=Psychrosphaera sp. F3M07 TaxID=2841560 RepID=UPI001C08EBA9|nr:tRNA pseudouridine(65) synthase TruC [Psychrosphaera sp. F3M07]MBU2917706.1 tRNA pseudouridine(65) synthase TruC [Psychrosphaera sp. F3M07]